MASVLLAKQWRLVATAFLPCGGSNAETMFFCKDSRQEECFLSFLDLVVRPIIFEPNRFKEFENRKRNETSPNPKLLHLVIFSYFFRLTLRVRRN